MSAKVLHVIPEYYPSTVFGGPIESIHQSNLALAARGLRVRVATTNLDGRPGGKHDVATDRDVELMPNYAVRYYPSSGKFLNWSMAFNANLAADMKAADVVHLQDVYSLHALLTFLFAAIQHKPLLVSPRGIFSSWALASGKAAIKKLYLSLLLKPLARWHGGIVWHATSASEQVDIQRAFPGASVRIIANAIDHLPLRKGTAADRQHLLQRYFAAKRPQENPLVAACLGRLHAIKSLETAIGAIALLKRKGIACVLILAGPDEGVRAQLEVLAEEHGVADAVHFPGALAGAGKAALFKGLDVYLCPSHSENFGLSVLEALGAGVPVVASKGTPWQALEVMKAGRWVENTPEAFAAAMEDIASRTAACSANALQLAETFDVKHQADAFAEVYAGLSQRTIP